MTRLVQHVSTFSSCQGLGLGLGLGFRLGSRQLGVEYRVRPKFELSMRTRPEPESNPTESSTDVPTLTRPPNPPAAAAVACSEPASGPSLRSAAPPDPRGTGLRAGHSDAARSGLGARRGGPPLGRRSHADAPLSTSRTFSQGGRGVRNRSGSRALSTRVMPRNHPSSQSKAVRDRDASLNPDLSPNPSLTWQPARGPR